MPKLKVLKVTPGRIVKGRFVAQARRNPGRRGVGFVYIHNEQAFWIVNLPSEKRVKGVPKAYSESQAQELARKAAARLGKPYVGEIR